ncbi:MAG: GxxExxY protein [Chthoniobacteraceae bacterium]
MNSNLKHEDLSRQIIGAAMEVLNELRPGQDERIYERALEVELGLRGLKVERQKQFQVTYKGVPIGTFIPDFIVEDLIIVDPKVVTEFNDAHIAQMLGYLAITRLSLALLFNFKHAKLEWRRVVPPSV